MTDLGLREQIADIVVSHTGHALNGLEYSETDAADAILELIKGAVKPLEWTGDKDAEVWAKAVTQIGTYFICDDTDDFSGFYLELISHDDARWWQHVRSTSEMIMDGHHDDDLSPLKAAAQADYSSRILAALGVK